MKTNGTLLLTGRDVSGLLTIDECMDAVEHVFKLYGKGETRPPGILGVHARAGGFHIKAGVLELNRNYFAAKINANFPENAARFGLPIIQGVLTGRTSAGEITIFDSTGMALQDVGTAAAVYEKALTEGVGVYLDFAPNKI